MGKNISVKTKYENNNIPPLTDNVNSKNDSNNGYILYVREPGLPEPNPMLKYRGTYLKIIITTTYNTNKNLIFMLLVPVI